MLVWAGRQLWRDWRGGELRVLVLAVTLAVAALTAVAFFVDRLDRGLTRDAAQLLGGDGVMVADQPLPPVFEQHAREQGLSVARMAALASMARADDEQGGATRLVAIKAVSAAYPLRGQLIVADAAGRESAHAAGPAPGEVWVESAVLESLGLQVGDALWLGDARLRIAHRLVIEPDRGAGFMAFAPRVLMHEADLPATGLVQPASRVSYRLAVAARRADHALDQLAARHFLAWAQHTVQARQLRGVRIDSLESGRPEVRQTLARAEQFLKLVALLAALLAAVAVAIAARDFATRRLDTCAMLRVLGLSQRRIAGAYAIEFLSVALLASAVGVALGLALHQVFVLLLGQLVGLPMPAPGWWPVGLGLGVGGVLCVGFGLPPVLQLARVPALRVMRRELGQPRAASLGVMAGAGLGFVALLLGVAAEPQLGAWAVGGFAAAAALFALGGGGAMVALRRALASAAVARWSTRWPRWWPTWMHLAARQMATRPTLVMVQVSSLGLGLFALILLVLLRTDLIDSWRRATPPDAPDRFVINVMPDQAEAFVQHLKDHGVQRFDWYPMVRGRLVAINGQAVRSDRYADDRARQLVDREFNLSYAAQPPAHNAVIGGQWQPGQAGALSVEAGLMQRLGLKLGDRLGFEVAAQRVEGQITSVRKVDWASMRVNFFVMFTQAQRPDLPSTHIAAFRAPHTAGFDASLTRAFANITVVDVGAQLRQMQSVLDQVIRAVEFLFVFTLAAGLAVLLSALLASREARVREFAVLRALGAGNRLLARVQAAELIGVGALAGALAAAAALGLGWGLALQVFEFDWQAPLWWLPLGALLGAALSWLVGWWGLRGVLARPLGQTLREAVS